VLQSKIHPPHRWRRWPLGPLAALAAGRWPLAACASALRRPGR